MNHRGFQLLELMVVFTLIALVSTWAVGYLYEILEEVRLETAGSSFLSEVSSARSLAMTRNRSLQVLVHPDRKRYAFGALGTETPASWNRLSEGVRFSQFPRSPVVFRSRGTATPAGTFTLTSPRGSVQIIVAVSGRIRWRRVE